MITHFIIELDVVYKVKKTVNNFLKIRYNKPTRVIKNLKSFNKVNLRYEIKMSFLRKIISYNIPIIYILLIFSHR